MGAALGGVPAMHAVTSLMRVQQLVLGRLDALLRPHGLTFARYEALVLLASPRADPCRWGRWGSACRCTRRRSPRSCSGSSRSGSSPAAAPRGRPGGARRDHRGRPGAGRGAPPRDLVGADFALESLSDEQLRELSDLLAPSAGRPATSSQAWRLSWVAPHG